MPGINGRNADPAFLRAKLARIREPHVAPLSQLADDIAYARGRPRGLTGRAALLPRRQHNRRQITFDGEMFFLHATQTLCKRHENLFGNY
ncbi:hypothetical protein [Mycobacterium asiaticum]|uniref:hypothetical protein n=1 Tax=Mycobacterium asiaticum TaxID=1790 RepID=UPI000A8C145E|nr:hypothetical protein [Mycobacterium asiaticum]